MSHELHQVSPEAAARRLERTNLVAALAFVAGGSLFALGAALAATDTALVTVNTVYLVGGAFFSLGGWTSVRLVRLGGPAGRRDPALRSAVVLFAGTLFFAVSLVAAFAVGLTPRQSDGWIWLPDITGCVCFLVSGQLALRVASAAAGSARARAAGWWVAVVNQAGSVLFFLAGLAAFVRPASAEVVNAQIVNWGTFAGALCFAAAGVVQAFDTPHASPRDEEPHP